MAIFKEGLIGGTGDDQSVVSIEQDVLAALELSAGVTQADHRGDLHRAGHDGGVRGLAADVRGEAEHQFSVQQRGGRGREIVADDDARFLELAQVGLIGPAQEIVQHTRGNIPHVGSPLAEILVVHRAERGGVFLGDLLESGLRVDPLFVDHAGDLVNQRRVLQHQQVRVEDAGVLGAHGLAHLALDLEDLLAGQDQRLFEALDFLRDFRLGNLVPRDVVAGLAQHDNSPRAHPSANGDAAQNLFS